MINNLFLITIFTSLLSGIIITFLGNKVGIVKFYIPYFFYFFISLAYVFYQFTYAFITHGIIYFKFFNLISFDGYFIPFSFVIDSLTIAMMFVVICISFFVFIFSIWYMKGDPNQLKFLNYLNFFMFFMLLLVASDSLVIIFIGWEGIGLFSYLLINFWNTRLNANRSGLKAIVVNKVGDVSLYFFISLFFFVFSLFVEKTTKSSYASFQNDDILLLNFDFSVLLCISLFLAAVAKSAQFFLHVWLPDAMEGPTPVSALLHAATMVTAGAYLLIKFNWLLHITTNIIYLVIITGLLTNFLSSFIAIFQYDLKKVIAYSTASQMGLIFIAIGSYKPFLAFFHLYNHAFFKALLFILAGIIIHMLNNKQDFRFLSIYTDKYFFLYSSFLISCLTLIGFPFLSAFYSKEIIIHTAFVNLNILPFYTLIFLFVSVSTTIIYTIKIFMYIFMYKTDSKSFKFKKFKKFENLKIWKFENLVYSVCLILMFLSIISGYIYHEVYYKSYLFINNDAEEIFFIEKNSQIEYFSLIIVVSLLLTGIIISLSIYKVSSNYFLFLSSVYLKILNFISRKFFFEAIFFYFINIFFSLRILVKEEKNFNENSFIAYLKSKKTNFLKVVKFIYGNKVFLSIFIIFFIIDIVLLWCFTYYFIASFFITLIAAFILNYFKWI